MSTITVDHNVLDSLSREISICTFAVRRLKDRCHEFEEKHGMSTEKFLDQFNNGGAGGDEELFEWYALAEGIKDWENRLCFLRKAVA